VNMNLLYSPYIRGTRRVPNTNSTYTRFSDTGSSIFLFGTDTDNTG
jgi:hypothetical protein